MDHDCKDPLEELKRSILDLVSMNKFLIEKGKRLEDKNTDLKERVQELEDMLHKALLVVEGKKAEILKLQESQLTR